MDEWRAKGYAEFTSDKPLTCPGLTQVFTKPSLLTGVIYELIERGEHGFCRENVKNLMESTKGRRALISSVGCRDKDTDDCVRNRSQAHCAWTIYFSLITKSIVDSALLPPWTSSSVSLSWYFPEGTCLGSQRKYGTKKSRRRFRQCSSFKPKSLSATRLPPSLNTSYFAFRAVWYPFSATQFALKVLASQ